MTPTPTDGEIVQAVLAGSRDQFAQLVARYRRALVRVAASRLGNADAAEDVVQESFLAAYKSLHTYDSRFSFRTWLWTILLNQCRRAFQKSRRRPPAISLPEAEEAEARTQSPAAGPPARLLAKEQSEQLDRLIRRLPEAQANALRLRFFGGLKFREIAAAMQCSLSSAKNRVRFGLTRLAEFAEQDSSVAPAPPENSA